LPALTKEKDNGIFHLITENRSEEIKGEMKMDDGASPQIGLIVLLAVAIAVLSYIVWKRLSAA